MLKNWHLSLAFTFFLKPMRHRFFFTLLAGLLFVGALAAPAQAQDRAKEIRTLLEQRDREIKSVLGDKQKLTQAQRDRLTDLINGVIDFKAMAKAALGPHWSKLTAPQRTEFVALFSDIVRAQSLANLDVYRSKVTYDKIDAKGNDARVVTTTVYKDVPTEVIYLMHFVDGAWYVTDIVLDEVSTADGYARSFQTVVRKKGYPALKTSLEKKRDKLNASS